jgi:hypothetical protein
MRTFVALWFVALASCQSPSPRNVSRQHQVAPLTEPTYYRDVAPILSARCQECHGAGEIAPAPSLADYENVRSYVDPIRFDVQARLMPLWGADDGGACGTWDGARWLADEEIATIVAWQARGAPEGSPDMFTAPEPPPKTPFTSSAVLDLGVYQPGLGAGGNRCFVVDPELDRDRLLTAIRVSSSDARAIAQVTLFALDSDAAEVTAEWLDANDPGPGYSCFGTSRATDARLVASWSWPTPVLRLPSGTGVRLHAQRKMVAQLHYDIATAGSQYQSATQVELELDDQATEAVVVPVAADGPLTPGLESVTVDGSQLVAREMRVVGVAPRMHLRGKSMTLISERGGATTCLGRFPHWSFYAGQLFRASSPALVEPNDELRVSCSFGTLGQTEPIVFGDAIGDEECVAYLFVTP